MPDTPPRGVAHVVTSIAPPGVSAGTLAGALPDDIKNAGRINIDVQVGPRGLQLVAMRGGSLVLARSGWTLDVDAAFVALGVVLAPMIARIANRTAAPVGDDL